MDEPLEGKSKTMKISDIMNFKSLVDAKKFVIIEMLKSCADHGKTIVLDNGNEKLTTGLNGWYKEAAPEGGEVDFLHLNYSELAAHAPSGNFDRSGYDQVICFNLLHLVEDIEHFTGTCGEMLKGGGVLHLSYPSRSHLTNPSKIGEKQIVNKVASEYGITLNDDSFEDIRPDDDILNRCFGRFTVSRFQKYDMLLNFGAYDAFREWHSPGAQVIFGHVDPEKRSGVMESYFESLYGHYGNGDYRPRLTTSVADLIYAG